MTRAKTTETPEKICRRIVEHYNPYKILQSDAEPNDPSIRLIVFVDYDGNPSEIAQEMIKRIEPALPLTIELQTELEYLFGNIDDDDDDDRLVYSRPITKTCTICGCKCFGNARFCKLCLRLSKAKRQKKADRILYELLKHEETFY